MILTFYLNKGTSVQALFPVIVVQQKYLSEVRVGPFTGNRNHL